MQAQAQGQIEIEDGLVLNNPSLEINTVNYDWTSYDVYVECIFTEENSLYKHSRTYKFSSEGNGELTSTDIINFIKGHEILNVFE
jgi:hypothetical protein